MIDPKQHAFAFARSFLPENAIGMVNKLAQHHKVTQNPAHWWLVIHSLALAQNAGDPRAFIGGILRNWDKVPKEARIVTGERHATREECEAFMNANPWAGQRCNSVPTWWEG